MTNDEFISRGRAEISNDPMSRLKTPVKELLKRNNFVVDAHTHIFDGKSIPVVFALLRLVGIKKGINNEVSDEEMATLNETLLNDFSLKKIYENEDEKHKHSKSKLFKSIKELKEFVKGLDRKDFGERLHAILKIARYSKMEEVYKLFCREFALNIAYFKENNVNKEILSIVLGMDLEPGWEYSNKIKYKLKSFEEQVKELSDLSESAAVIPFLPIDPRRLSDTGFTNLHTLFLWAFNAQQPKFYGVKIYNSMGYLPQDERLTSFFQLCAEKNIPIVSHCGGELIHDGKTKFHYCTSGTCSDIPKEGTGLKENARFMNDPLHWGVVLARPGMKNLRLNLAHFGGGNSWMDEEPINRKNDVLHLMETYSNVFTDFSFNIDDSKAVDNFMNKAKQSEVIQKKTMFGTDYWVVLPNSNLIEDQRYFIEKTKQYENAFLKENALSFLGINNEVQDGPIV